MNHFDIIRHRGAPRRATTLKGREVTRQEKLFVPEWNAWVPCAPYDDQFLYENPEKSDGTSAYLCTCGSVAVVINPERDAGRLFVCLFHATYGSHTTSHVNLKDWLGIASQEIEVKGDKRWL
jgi:hypothetical protein